jgi:hypothetical protein
LSSQNPPPAVSPKASKKILHEKSKSKKKEVGVKK